MKVRPVQYVTAIQIARTAITVITLQHVPGEHVNLSDNNFHAVLKMLCGFIYIYL
jgi:hypothetical protein